MSFPRRPYGMKMVMMTASLHQWYAGTAGEPVLGAGTKDMAWRGGGATGLLLDDPVTPRPAAPRPHREPASNLSMESDLRT